MITTKHGNQYSKMEWANMMGDWNQEIAEANDYLDAVEVIKEKAAKALEAIGVTGNTYGIAHRILVSGLEGISFSSVEKQAQVEALAVWMSEQEGKLD